jgi:hypothetical protein
MHRQLQIAVVVDIEPEAIFELDQHLSLTVP